MSCITEILKLKGDAEIMPFPDNNEIVIEGGGSYKGYEYIITFTSMGHRCSYVAITPDHPLYGKDQASSSDGFDLCVHGGITFHQQEHSIKKLLKNPCLDEWLGFDAAHGYDIPSVETSEKYFGLTKWVEYMKNNSFYTDHRESKKMGMTHKTFEYMEQECFKLIDQLIEIKKAA